MRYELHAPVLRTTFKQVSSDCREEEKSWQHYITCCCTPFPPQAQEPEDSQDRLIHTQRQTTIALNPLDEGSARRKKPLPDNTQRSKQAFMRPQKFEPAIPASEWPQTPTSDRSTFTVP